MTTVHAEPEMIRLITPLGAFEAPGDAVITFPDGLPGFEQCHRFVLLHQSVASPLMCLHAIDGPVAFLVVDPRQVQEGYQPDLSPSDRRRLEAEAGQTLLWLAVVTATGQGELTANLRAPIVVNPVRLTGVQLLSESTVHPLRYPIPAAVSRPRDEVRPCSS